MRHEDGKHRAEEHADKGYLGRVERSEPMARPEKAEEERPRPTATAFSTSDGTNQTVSSSLKFNDDGMMRKLLTR